MDIPVNIMQVPLAPGDPRLIDSIVNQLKSQGIFDQFRKECLADVDTKPAYQNLRQRVEGSVNSFLKKQKWRPDLNKNQLRDGLRKHIHETGILDMGVQRVVDQVLNPKVYGVFMPKVEEVVYNFLGIEKPQLKKEEWNGVSENTTCTPNMDFLLPMDLDPVSPPSPHKCERISEDEAASNTPKLEIIEEAEESTMVVTMEEPIEESDEEESPPFEKLNEEELSCASFGTWEKSSEDSDRHRSKTHKRSKSSKSSSKTRSDDHHSEKDRRHHDRKSDRGGGRHRDRKDSSRGSVSSSKSNSESSRSKSSTSRSESGKTGEKHGNSDTVDGAHGRQRTTEQSSKSKRPHESEKHSSKNMKRKLEKADSETGFGSVSSSSSSSRRKSTSSKEKKVIPQQVHKKHENLDLKVKEDLSPSLVDEPVRYFEEKVPPSTFLISLLKYKLDGDECDLSDITVSSVATEDLSDYEQDTEAPCQLDLQEISENTNILDSCDRGTGRLEVVSKCATGPGTDTQRAVRTPGSRPPKRERTDSKENQMLDGQPKRIRSRSNHVNDGHHSQRYDSSDLYKPRPLFTPSTRRQRNNIHLGSGTLNQQGISKDLDHLVFPDKMKVE